MGTQYEIIRHKILRIFKSARTVVRCSYSFEICKSIRSYCCQDACSIPMLSANSYVILKRLITDKPGIIRLCVFSATGIGQWSFCGDWKCWWKVYIPGNASINKTAVHTSLPRLNWFGWMFVDFHELSRGDISGLLFGEYSSHWWIQAVEQSVELPATQASWRSSVNIKRVSVQISLLS